MIPFGLEALMTHPLSPARRAMRRATKCLAPGASAIYLFNEGSGQVLTDYSGNGNDGTLGANSGSSTDDPAFGSTGLTFDGGDFVEIPHAPFASTFAAGFTIQMVLYPGGATSKALFTLGQDKGFSLYHNQSKALLYAPDGASILYTSANSAPATTWVDIAYTHTWGGLTQAYVNGAADTSVTNPGAHTAPTACRIGYYAGFFAQAGTVIAALALYPGALTAGQIAQNHTALRGMLAARGITLA